MIQSSPNLKFKNMYTRLEFSSEKTFTPTFFDRDKYVLLVAKKDDIFFTNPALILWVDTGDQKIERATATAKTIKLINSKVFEIPKRDFVETDKIYSDILCLVNLEFNPNLSSKLEMDNYLRDLKTMINKAQLFFTAEHYSQSTF